MDIETVRAVLGWCAVINLGLLLWWFLFFVFAHDWMCRLHGRWFNLPVERFDAIHYSGMAIFKLGIVMFNLVPWVVLKFVH